MFYNDDKEKVEVSLVGKIIYNKKNGIYKVPLSEDLKEWSFARWFIIWVEELENFLSEFKFERVLTSWDGNIWGDALYLKK